MTEQPDACTGTCLGIAQSAGKSNIVGATILNQRRQSTPSFFLGSK